MKTILIPFYNLGLGGVQTKIIDLANALVKISDVKVIVYLEKKTIFDRGDELDPRVRVIFCPQIGLNFVKRRFYYFLVFIIYWFRPFSIFVSLEDTSVFLLDIQSKLPFFPSKLILNVDTYIKMEQKNCTETISKLYNRASAVLSPSRAMTFDFLNRLKVRKPPLVELPNWIEVGKLQVKMPPKKWDLLYAGRLEPQKNPMMLIEFMKILHQAGDRSKLVIYGEGSLKNELLKSIRTASLSSLISLKPITYQLEKEIVLSRFFLLLSDYEGSPLVGLEAMKFGSILLGLNRPGVEDLIKDGKTGYCKKTVAELAAAYLSIKENRSKQQRMTAAAFSYLKTNFDQRVRTKLIDLLTNTKQ